MRGLARTTSSSGCPLPGDEAVEFTREDVLQLGKLYCWGSSCVQFIVRLRDGREVFARADRQDREEERFLRRLARSIRGWAPGRSEGFRTVWGAVVGARPPLAAASPRTVDGGRLFGDADED